MADLTPQSGYQGLAATWHDAFWEKYGEPDELDLLRDFLALHPGPALYLGSGSGRLFCPLKKTHPELRGLEPSATMRQLCEQKAHALGLTPPPHLLPLSWQSLSSSNLPPSPPLTSLLVPTFTAQLLGEPRAFLEKAHALLPPTAALYLTVFSPLEELANPQAHAHWQPEDELHFAEGQRVTLLQRTHFLSEHTLRREQRYQMWEGDQLLTEETHQEHLHFQSPTAWQTLFAQTGWAPTRRHDDWQPEPISPTAPPSEEPEITTWWLRKTP